MKKQIFFPLLAAKELMNQSQTKDLQKQNHPKEGALETTFSVVDG